MTENETKPSQESNIIKFFLGFLAFVIVMFLVYSVIMKPGSDNTEMPDDGSSNGNNENGDNTSGDTVMPSGDWVLVTYIQEGSTVEIPSAVDITLTITGAEFAGNSGCNSYFGSYEVSSDVVSVSPIGMTLMACGEEIDSFEQSYLKTLQETGSFRTFGDTKITLYSGVEGKTALDFEISQ